MHDQFFVLNSPWIDLALAAMYHECVTVDILQRMPDRDTSGKYPKYLSQRACMTHQSDIHGFARLRYALLFPVAVLEIW